jgi:hypothetical protein
VAQLDDLAHQRRVVPVGWAGLGGAGDIGAIQPLAKRAIAGVLHHRQVGRCLQRESVAGVAGFARGGGRRLERVVRQPVERAAIGLDVRVRVGRIEQVVGEAGAQRRQPLGQFAIALLALGRQFGA